MWKIDAQVENSRYEGDPLGNIFSPDTEFSRLEATVLMIYWAAYTDRLCV